MIESLTDTNEELVKFPCGNYTGRYEFICKLSEVEILQRLFKDSRGVDTHNRYLLELCKAPGLLIFNDRVGKDKAVGVCTRVDQTSSKRFDYVIATPGLLGRRNDFEINKKFPESDHLPTTFGIR